MACAAEFRSALHRALCFSSFPSPLVERHNKPCIELATNPELILPSRKFVLGQDIALIEQSINSTRVSFRIRAEGRTEHYLLQKFLRFTIHRAEELDIVRKVPVPGYNLTFLITNTHLKRYHREAIIDILLRFVEDVHAEIAAMKLSLHTRARAVIGDYWEQLQQQQAHWRQ